MPLQTLKQAVKEVIKQNELLGFHPKIFIFQTKRGEAPNLDYRVSNLVESKTAIEAVVKAIKKYGNILTIEDFIVINENGFGLPQNIIDKAKQNTDYYRQNINDLRYIEDEEKFLNHSFDIFKKYFNNDRKSFNAFYKSIGSEDKKNKFLKIASFYKFLVVDGKFIVENNKLDIYIDYLNDTYKYIAMFSFIEDLYTNDEYKDFYSWLKNKEEKIKFPIEDSAELDNLNKRYLSVHGSTQKAVKFFESLDDKTKKHIADNFQVSGEKKESFISLAKLFYQIRSDFVHNAKIVAQFNKGTTIHSIGKKQIKNNLEFKDIKIIFENGFLKFFNYKI